jgi:hypothetical protein
MRRSATILLTLWLALPIGTQATLPAARAADGTIPVPASASAAWLAALLIDGERMVNPEFEIDDVDLTLDVLLGLVAARSAGVEQQRILTWFGTGLAQHVGTAADAAYIATAAKGALAVMALGVDPRTVGDVDLIALLVDRIGTDGRARDRGALGDLSSTASQALTVLALERAGADAAATERAAGFLAGSACADGGFAVELTADDCAAHLVPTALAVQALAASGGHDDALAAATAALITALETGVRDADVSEGWQLGLASLALRAAGEDDAAQRLAATLIDRLDGCSGQASGALLEESDPVRATAGALLAASGATLTTLGGAGSTPGAALLDCGTADEPTVPDLSEVTTDDDSPATREDRSGGPTPVMIGLVLLALVVFAGPPLLRRLREGRGYA